MISRNYILGQLSPYMGKEAVIVENQDTNDIIKNIVSWHKRYADHYKNIAANFKGKTDKQTAQNIFNFLKQNIKYVIESEDKQTLKTPAAILAQGKGDCKHYSLFAAGILQNLGIPFSFRFASYKWFDETPGHVFVVMYPGTGREIWIDPVLSQLDEKKNYTHSIDKKMALVGISGIGQTAPAPKKQKLKEALKKGGKVVLKVAAAPARGAFLTLVRLNIFGLANKIKQLWKNKPASLRNFWEGKGGRIDALVKAAEAAGKKKKGKVIGELGTTTAIITAASPILVAIISLFKKEGINTVDIEAAGNQGLNERAQQALENNNVQPATETGKKLPIIPIMAGGAIVLYLITRKK